mmetsp:Transcript_21309/g.20451  ORF Transcript_21309/g.20451 Transcript_21309/m.20451 type:complete len:146 (+) Transcript_21309:1020-1457(+)
MVVIHHLLPCHLLLSLRLRVLHLLTLLLDVHLFFLFLLLFIFLIRKENTLLRIILRLFLVLFQLLLPIFNVNFRNHIISSFVLLSLGWRWVALFLFGRGDPPGSFLSFLFFLVLILFFTFLSIFLVGHFSPVLFFLFLQTGSFFL